MMLALLGIYAKRHEIRAESENVPPDGVGGGDLGPVPDAEPA